MTKKFCTLTGNVIRNRGVEERSVELGEILETYMLRPIPKKKNEVQDIPGSYLSDDSVVRLASDSRQVKSSKPCGMEKSRKENLTAMRICRLQVSLRSGVVVIQSRWTGCSEDRD